MGKLKFKGLNNSKMQEMQEEVHDTREYQPIREEEKF
jgi:hypothetical protein